MPSTPAATPPNLLPLARPKPNGRPTLLTPEVRAVICAAIRRDGHSDSSAGLLAGVSTSTLSRWKQDNEDFATELGQARAEFLTARLEAIRHACKRDGTPDWRAQVWLLQHAAPEDYGPPSRRLQPQPPQPPASDPVPFVVTPEQLQQLQERRARWLDQENAKEPAKLTPSENHPNLPETPTPTSVVPAHPIHPSIPILPIIPTPPPHPNPPETPHRAPTLRPSPAPSRPQSAQEAEDFRQIARALDQAWSLQPDAPLGHHQPHATLPGMWAGQ